MMWNDGGERWRMHESTGAGWLMVILMLVVAVAVVIAVVALLRGSTPLATTPAGAAVRRGVDPRTILQERLARGEIDEDDFRARLRALDESGG